MAHPTLKLAPGGGSVFVLNKVHGVKIFDNGMTLLNLGADFPNHLMVVMIRAEARSKFSFNPEELKGKQIVVTAKIIDYKSKREIIATESDQILQVNVASNRD